MGKTQLANDKRNRGKKMHNIELINKSTTDANATHGAYPDSSAVLKSMLNREIQSAIGYRSAISVDCKNGVVTLNGYFANKNDKNKALHKAITNPGVCKVINNTN